MVVMSEAPEVLAAVDQARAELAELCGQRNAVTARMVEVVARVAADDLWVSDGARSLEHWVAWKGGMSRSHAEDLVAIARRAEALPATMAGFHEGVLSEDQVAVIARKAPEGAAADAHFAELARHATVSQLRTAIRITNVSRPPAPAAEPAADGADDAGAPAPAPAVERRVTSFFDDEGGHHLRSQLPVEEGAFVDQALRAELEALVKEHKRLVAARGDDDAVAPRPFPTLADALVRLIERAVGAAAKDRPAGAQATVVVHLEVGTDVAELHLGPVLSEAERRYLSCDARWELWLEREGVPIGAARTTRKIPRRLRRALERRDRCCQVPGCGATAGLHAHHIIHWEDGGPTELWNLVLVCPYHHRLHHRGFIRIVGPADALRVYDRRDRLLDASSLARPPSAPPPAAPAYRHPSGERAYWKWYQPPRLDCPG